jgi:predicted acyl esterase
MSDIEKTALLSRCERYEEFLDRYHIDKETGRIDAHECSACGKLFKGAGSYLKTRQHIETCEQHPLAESLEVERELRAKLDAAHRMLAEIGGEP